VWGTSLSPEYDKAQCEAGIEWLHDRHLIIPGETWVNSAVNDPDVSKMPLGPVQITKGKIFGQGVQSSDDPDQDCVSGEECKWNPDGEIIIPQTNDDYDENDPSILSAYLECGVGAGQTCTGKSCENNCYVTAAGKDRITPSKTGQTLPINTFYSRIKVDYNNNEDIGSYRNNNGHFALKGTEGHRPIPGQDGPGLAGFAPPPGNDTTPSGCYVNLTSATPFPGTNTYKTGSLWYNTAENDVDATPQRPRICQATVEYPDVKFGTGLCDDVVDSGTCGQTDMRLLYTGR
jgi:hypothetical protein